MEKSEPQQKTNNLENKKIASNKLPPKINEEQIDLADNNKIIDQYFTIKEIEGDGNCLFKSILESLNLDKSKHKVLREIAANAIETKDWDQNILKALDTNNAKNLADKVRQEDSFVGETAILPLAEKLGITIAIYLKDTTKQWIKENNIEGQDIHKENMQL